MEFKRVLNPAVKMVATFAFLFIFAITNTVAASGLPSLSYYNKGTLIVDAFNQLYYRPDARAFWHTEHIGVDSNGSPSVVREVPCALQSCVEQKTEGFNKFVRLTLKSHSFNLLTISNLSEEFDGGDNEVPPIVAPGSWTPTLNHPVVLSTRMRYSPNMAADGTGGGRGAAGIWLWSNPFSQGYGIPAAFAEYHGIGFNWTSTGHDFLEGLNATVAYSGFPAYKNPISIDMSNWNTYTFVWSALANGDQKVQYYVNTTAAGETILPNGVLTLENLSLEVWLDNQELTFSGLQYVNVPQEQYIDVDSVVISKI